jgi:hypothetical protein
MLAVNIFCVIKKVYLKIMYRFFFLDCSLRMLDVFKNNWMHVNECAVSK